MNVRAVAQMGNQHFAVFAVCIHAVYRRAAFVFRAIARASGGVVPIDAFRAGRAGRFIIADEIDGIAAHGKIAVAVPRCMACQIEVIRVVFKIRARGQGIADAGVFAGFKIDAANRYRAIAVFIVGGIGVIQRAIRDLQIRCSALGNADRVIFRYAQYAGCIGDIQIIILRLRDEAAGG